jgi:hypothetical protein
MDVKEHEDLLSKEEMSDGELHIAEGLGFVVNGTLGRLKENMPPRTYATVVLRCILPNGKQIQALATNDITPDELIETIERQREQFEINREKEKAK